MAAATAVSLKGPTVATLKAIEEVLRKEAVPLTRYRIRQLLGNRISQPLLDEALEYLADHAIVYDEGPGGQVLWIHAPPETHAFLRGKLAVPVARPHRAGGQVRNPPLGRNRDFRSRTFQTRKSRSFGKT